MIIGATTAEQLEGTSRGVGADPLPFRLRPFDVSRLPMFHPFPSLLFFPSPLNLARRSGEALYTRGVREQIFRTNSLPFQ